MYYGFQLGREYKLSIAELFSVFPESVNIHFDKSIIILDNLEKDAILEKAKDIGGTIKIFEINNEEISIEDIVLKDGDNYTGKFKYGVSTFGSNQNLRTILKNIKSILQKNEISSRFINKDFQNLSSAQIIGEKLIQKQSDYSIINTIKKVFVGKTIWVQDIEDYSKRDYEKARDMNIGMLPPKLSQIMINLLGESNSNVFDPFVGLGTILIESIYMGKGIVFGSDFNPEMIEKSNQNISKIKGLDSKSKIIKFDARDIGDNPIIKENKNLNIVTEGFLGEIMTKKNISIERIKIQRNNLSKLYEKFFLGLKKVNFEGTLIISFPFWEMNGKYTYFNEIYNILEKYTEIIPLFPTGIDIYPSKSGSLLYKRKSQLVGREIFKLTINI